jgi:hypothetical protein
LVNAGYATQNNYSGAVSGNLGDMQTSPFAEPFVLTVNSSGKVVLAALSELGTVVSPTQLWANWSSPAQSQLRAQVAKSS